MGAKSMSTVAIQMRPGRAALTLLVASALMVACSETPAGGEGGESSAPASSTAAADAPGISHPADRALQAPAAGEWPAYGLDYREQRFSPLTAINRDTVAGLGLAFVKPLDSRFALQATPIMVDGTLYFTTDWSRVVAMDARTGAERWRFDPEVPRAYLRKSTYGTANRGVAVYGGRVYVGTVDGRLVALDAATGEPVWSVDTVVDRRFNYTITGAPRAARGKVFIGNAGAEFGVRGYLSAYDASSGELVWRFFTVPGDPAEPVEHPELEAALATWTGDRWWHFGGGGTVWNAIVYDPDFNQLYLGVGNGSPLARAIRSPGGGDNLYLSSIVALDADTGRMRWYYQTTPGDTWDYTATQDMALAELEVDGERRKVLLQAPKNGFFYVLDRATGELLRAHPYVKTTWATHVDMTTGRPVENPAADFSERAARVWPGPLGGHNWQAMAVDPASGVTFLPAMEHPGIYALDPGFKATGEFERNPGAMNIGFGPGDLSHLPPTPPSYGYLQAFDPLSGETLWRVTHRHYFNGGVLATAGGLVFQGDAFGTFAAYDSSTGERLWDFDSFTSIVAPPITYAIDGEQYVALLAATGGGEHYSGHVADTAAIVYGNSGKLFVFKLGGDATWTEPPKRDRSIPEPPPVTASAEQLAAGNGLYHSYCANCHGALGRSAGVYPDLRRMARKTHGAFDGVVRGGLLAGNGMASFADVLTAADAESIRQYLASRAREDRAAESSDQR